MPFEKINGVSIHYDTFGSGQSLILIPGWGGSGESWRPEMIKLLAERCTVITYDPRGTGQSEKPDTPYTMKMFAEDAAGLIKALKLAPTNVMGFSMGGSVAQVLALEHPEVVKSLILCCSSASGGPRVLMKPESAAKFATISNPPPGAPPDYDARVIVDLLYPPEYVAAHREELVHEEFYSEHPTPKETLNRMSTAMGTYTTYDKLHTINVPTLVMAGGKDAMVSAENSKVIVSRIAGSQLKIFPSAGHGLLKQYTKMAVAEILDFLP